MIRMTYTAHDGRTATATFASFAEAKRAMLDADGIGCHEWAQKFCSLDLFHYFGGDRWELTEVAEVTAPTSMRESYAPAAHAAILDAMEAALPAGELAAWDRMERATSPAQRPAFYRTAGPEMIHLSYFGQAA